MTHDDRDEPQGPGRSAPPDDVHPSQDPPGPVITTTDEAVLAGQPVAPRPDETIVAETGGVASPLPTLPTGGPPRKDDAPAGRGKDAGDDRQQGKNRPAHAGRPAWLHYVLTGVVALACGMGGAWAFSNFFASKDQAKQGDKDKKGDDDSSKSQPKGKGEEGLSGSTRVEDAGDGGPLRDQLENLTARFEVLRQRVEGMVMPRDTNPPDLAGLRMKVDELSKASDASRDLPSRFREVEDRMDRLQGEVKALRDQIASDRERAHPVIPSAATPDGGPKHDAPARPSPPPPSPPSASPTATESPDSAMDQGVAMFKKRMYPQAEAIFRNLRTTRPEDARVWYYSALTNGLATGKWDGETRNFVIQGAERERAGLPPAAEIDSAFADLSPASGKDWLASYRAQLVKR